MPSSHWMRRMVHVVSSSHPKIIWTSVLSSKTVSCSQRLHLIWNHKEQPAHYSIRLNLVLSTWSFSPALSPWAYCRLHLPTQSSSLTPRIHQTPWSIARKIQSGRLYVVMLPAYKTFWPGIYRVALSLMSTHVSTSPSALNHSWQVLHSGD